MTSFIYIAIAATAFDIIGNLLELGTGRITVRTPTILAWNVAMNVALLVYGVLALRGAA